MTQIATGGGVERARLLNENGTEGDWGRQLFQFTARFPPPLHPTRASILLSNEWSGFTRLIMKIKYVCQALIMKINK